MDDEIKKSGKYSTQGMTESEFEPGSNESVLKNKLHITDIPEIEAIETEKLAGALDHFIRYFSADHQFTCKDIAYMHKYWLGDIYPWSGHYRNVNMSKGDFTFAAAHLIEKLMNEFEKDILSKYTPCCFNEKPQILEALSVVHVELVLIHPFREGNGRLARLLSILQALQAGLPFIDFGYINEDTKPLYFSAIQSGLDKNYKPMEGMFKKILEKSL